MIQVQDLTKRYGQFEALHQISFDAREGEILGFLGPNGAGKTTTMRILSGYLPPSEGKVEVAGHDVVDESLEVRRRVGYLPETVPLYPDLSVTDYLDYMGGLHRVENRTERIDQVIEEVGLVDRSNSFIGNLSKGLRQRVGLAQALLHSPSVLILDEPTIGLDPAQIIEVRNLIQELGGERTVLLSTHILSEAQQLCDRVLIINHGRLVAEDTPANLQAQLAGAERLLVRSSADSKTLITLLQRLEGVEAVQGAGYDEAVEIAASPGQDVRAKVARAVIEAGHDLLELRTVGLSLESIFLQLTQDGEPPSE